MKDLRAIKPGVLLIIIGIENSRGGCYSSPRVESRIQYIHVAEACKLCSHVHQ